MWVVFGWTHFHFDSHYCQLLLLLFFGKNERHKNKTENPRLNAQRTFVVAAAVVRLRHSVHFGLLFIFSIIQFQFSSLSLVAACQPPPFCSFLFSAFMPSISFKIIQCSDGNCRHPHHKKTRMDVLQSYLRISEMSVHTQRLRLRQRQRQNNKFQRHI